MLAVWCSVRVLGPVSGLCVGMADARVSRRGWRAVPWSAAPQRRGGSSFPWGYGVAAGYEKPGANTVTWGFPVMVVLVAEAWGNFGRAFCARGE